MKTNINTMWGEGFVYTGILRNVVKYTTAQKEQSRGNVSEYRVNSGRNNREAFSFSFLFSGRGVNAAWEEVSSGKISENTCVGGPLSVKGL